MKCKECKFSNEKRVCYKTGEIEQAHDNDDTYCAYYEPSGTGQDNKEHIEIKKITMEEVVKRFEALDFWKWEHQEGYMQAYKDLGLIKE